MVGFRGSKRSWIRDSTEQPHVLILLSEKRGTQHELNNILRNYEVISHATLILTEG